MLLSVSLKRINVSGESWRKALYSVVTFMLCSTAGLCCLLWEDVVFISVLLGQMQVIS